MVTRVIADLFLRKTPSKRSSFHPSYLFRYRFLSSRTGTPLSNKLYRSLSPTSVLFSFLLANISFILFDKRCLSFYERFESGAYDYGIDSYFNIGFETVSLICREGN